MRGNGNLIKFCHFEVAKRRIHPFLLGIDHWPAAIAASRKKQIGKKKAVKKGRSANKPKRRVE
jgi:hypothetical protein